MWCLMFKKKKKKLFTLEWAKVKIQDISSEKLRLNGHNKPSYKTASHLQPSSNNRCKEANMKKHVSSHNMPPKMQDLAVA